MRLLLVLTLIFLTIQGWFGDTVNLFAVPSGPVTVDASLGSILTAVVNVGPTLIIHAFIGLAILALALVVLTFSLKSKPRSVQIPSILGLIMVISAIIGGTLFVLSGFSNNGVSAQMGGSFIGAYAFYFIELYYAK
ncbi:MAG TPA: hypothetical protein VFE96_07990 [Candidatus Bathyarchaeia archaeon]|nr:hypothetical protein [Candidatus Bathyarchaeia archaeon]